MAFPGGMHTNT